MTGYTRVSVAQIVNGQAGNASPVANEFNAIQTAFGTGGHTHDGTSGNGPKIVSSSVTGQDWIVQTAKTLTTATATGTTTVPLDNTIPQNTEGDQYFTQAITPLANGNILYIDVVIVLSNTAAGHMTVALFQDATANALAAVTQKITTADDAITMTLRYQMTAGTTIATTFKVRAGLDGAGTTRINGRAGAGLFNATCTSYISVTEIQDT